MIGLVDDYPRDNFIVHKMVEMYDMNWWRGCKELNKEFEDHFNAAREAFPEANVRWGYGVYGTKTFKELTIEECPESWFNKYYIITSTALAPPGKVYYHALYKHDDKMYMLTLEEK